MNIRQLFTVSELCKGIKMPDLQQYHQNIFLIKYEVDIPRFCFYKLFLFIYQ